MSNGADKDYKFGNKNNWRRWQWNRIVERLKDIVLPRNAVVLFLCGEDALDIPIALSRGFRRENLFAIENNDDVAAALRANGILTIRGSLIDVLTAWNPNLKIDVIIADFCGPFALNKLALASQLVTYTFLKDTVVSINLMRGRDPLVMNYLANDIPGCIPGHRFDGFINYTISYMVNAAKKITGKDMSSHYYDDLKLLDWISSTSNMCVRRYKNDKSLTFDCGIFNNRFPALWESVGGPLSRWDKCHVSKKVSSAVLQVRAIKAVRTRRINDFASN